MPFARLAALVTLLALAGCAGPRSSAPAPGASAPAPAPADAGPGASRVETLPSGLRLEDLTVGDGTLAEKGMTAIVHYTGWLADGTQFDSSLDRDQPFQFRIGAGSVIRGWDEGVVGMRAGGKRKLTIPPALGYGDRPVGPIPANSTLVFEVQLLAVR